MKLVLVVEDEYGHAEILQLVLEGNGYRVAAAANGNVALELLAGEKPALILSDFTMPHCNGAELGNAVRNAPALREIPFVFMSGTSEDVVRRLFNDYDAFLPKPFDTDRLIEVVERLIAAGRPVAARDPEVDESMRQLVKGIKLPPTE